MYESGVQGESGAGGVNLGTDSVWKRLSTMRWMRSSLRTHCQGRETQKLCQLGVLGKSWGTAAVTSTTLSAQAELMPSCQVK